MPSTSAAFDPSAEQLPLNIFLKREDGGNVALFWNEERVKNEDEFRGRLSDMHPNKDQEVSISADKDIAYDNVVPRHGYVGRRGNSQNIASYEARWRQVNQLVPYNRGPLVAAFFASR